ncbi:MAG: type II secretion system F family protein, partial [Candidatus Bathyarchaeia archaeon]
MPKIERSVKRIVWAASALIAIAITVLGFFAAWGTQTVDEFVFFAVIAAFTPPAVLNYVDYRWKRAVDDRLPDLFRSIVQAQETGMTLPRALEESAKRDYGPLTAELRKMNAQISWGMTLEEALVAFARRVNTVLVQRTVPLIIEA